MTFSRSHTGMVGIISLFTGMIAPIAGSGGTGYPFPLTDMQTLAYIVLFMLAIGFYLVSVRKWGGFRLVGIILLVLLGYMSSVAFSGELHSIQGNTLLTDMRWGWVFICVGYIAIIYTILVTGDKDEAQASIFSDAIIGIVGTMTLVGLSALIIGASLPGGSKKNTDTVLSEVFGTGTTPYMSGLAMSPPYKTVENLSFERKNDSIKFIEKTESGGILHPSGVFYPGVDIQFRAVGGKDIVTSASGTWIDSIPLGSDEEVYILGDALVIKNKETLSIKTKEGSISYTGTDIDVGSMSLSEENDVAVWRTKTSSGYTLVKNGKTISEVYRGISHLNISKSGYDTTAIAETMSGELIILKNGIPTETIRDGYIDGSFKSNGSHNIYITKQDNVMRLIYDGVSIGKDFTEVREVFIEKSGNAYAFFARPIGSNEYCLFTRYRGNLCGLSGYMNPRLGADGSTIIYAGLRLGIWGIYKNTDTLIRDTGYSSMDISGDYVFFDITNPKQYLFVVRAPDGTYTLRKNGKALPHIWKDVGLDVTFGYNNIVIMSVKDETGWRIIEIQ